MKDKQTLGDRESVPLGGFALSTLYAKLGPILESILYARENEIQILRRGMSVLHDCM